MGLGNTRERSSQTQQMSRKLKYSLVFLKFLSYFSLQAHPFLRLFLKFPSFLPLETMLKSAFTWAWRRGKQTVSTDGNSALSTGKHNYKCYENTGAHEIRGKSVPKTIILFLIFFFFTDKAFKGKRSNLWQV